MGMQEWKGCMTAAGKIILAHRLLHETRGSSVFGASVDAEIERVPAAAPGNTNEFVSERLFEMFDSSGVSSYYSWPFSKFYRHMGVCGGACVGCVLCVRVYVRCVYHVCCRGSRQLRL